jgi:uncharacterized delta-60 repeat protein
VAFALACLLFAAVAATALAGPRGGVDRSFGNRGVVDLSSLLREDRYGFISQMAVGPGRSIYLLGVETACSYSCFREYRLLRLLPDGRLDTTYGNGGAAVVGANVQHDFRDPVLSVDSAGRAAVAESTDQTISVFRLAADGSPDASFGNGGTVTLSCECGELTPGIRFDDRGRILIGGGIEPYGYRPAGASPESKLWAVRLTPQGLPDPGFGVEGRVEEARRNGRGVPGRSLVRGNGSLLLGGREESSAGIYLTRIGSKGRIDRRFSARLGRSLRALGLPPGARPVSVAGIAPRRRGAMDVFGRTHGGGFVLRVHGNGSLDSRFSKDGFKRLPWRLAEVIPAGLGRVVGTSDSGGGVEVMVLSRNGRLDRSAGRHPVVLRNWRSFGSLSLAMQGRRPLLFGTPERFCRSYCASEPKLVRLKALR